MSYVRRIPDVATWHVLDWPALSEGQRRALLMLDRQPVCEGYAFRRLLVHPLAVAVLIGRGLVSRDYYSGPGGLRQPCLALTRAGQEMQAEYRRWLRANPDPEEIPCLAN